MTATITDDCDAIDGAAVAEFYQGPAWDLFDLAIDHEDTADDAEPFPLPYSWPFFSRGTDYDLQILTPEMAERLKKTRILCFNSLFGQLQEIDELQRWDSPIAKNSLRALGVNEPLDLPFGRAFDRIARLSGIADLEETVSMVNSEGKYPHSSVPFGLIASGIPRSIGSWTTRHCSASARSSGWSTARGTRLRHGCRNTCKAPRPKRQSLAVATRGNGNDPRPAPPFGGSAGLSQRSISRSQTPQRPKAVVPAPR